MKYILILILGMTVVANHAFSQPVYPDNEDGLYEDMLTPLYYLSESGNPFRTEVNKFVYYARMDRFRHPLEDSLGQHPQYVTLPRGSFGAGIGPNGTGEHHPAVDLYIGNSETDVDLHAACDGRVSISRDIARYRHYLSITKDVTDSAGVVLGKIVVLFAHIDLDHDSAVGLVLDGQMVSKGDIVSRHLYSGTAGGPHLHFEIRYYRAEDAGTEEFYGIAGPNGAHLTEPSTGSWQYGHWDPNAGYGFANPENHLSDNISGFLGNDPLTPAEYRLEQNYPNPFNSTTEIRYHLASAGEILMTVYDLLGREVVVLAEGPQNVGQHTVRFDGAGLSSGVYIYRLTAGEYSSGRKLLLLK